MIFDSTPLIHITRAGYGDIFRFFPCVIPPEVFAEVVTAGAERPDAVAVNQLVERGVIMVVERHKEALFQKFHASAAGLGYPLSATDAAVLALAEERDEVAVVDERAARRVAEAFGIPTRGSLSLFIELFHRGKWTRKEVLEALDKLLATGWRLSAEEYVRVRRRVEELK